MKKVILLTLVLSFSFTLTSCEFSGVGTGGYVDDHWSGDDWDSGWDSGWDDDDDVWEDDDWTDWGDDWDDDWDDDDDGCWDCGDDWGWYDDNQRNEHSTDIMGDVASKEELKLAKVSEFFTDKFNLSADQGLKIAKTMQDYDRLSERTADDLADFSQKLYGLNPEEIVSGVASAQLGDHSKLDLMIEKAAKNFNTTTQNMREIVKALHGNALNDNGIEL